MALTLQAAGQTAAADVPEGAPDGAPPEAGDACGDLGCTGDEFWDDILARLGGRSLEAPIADCNGWLAELAARYSGAPVQRTEAWHQARLGRVGGSELAAAMGLNPYCSPAQLLAKKCGLGGRDDPGTPCHWGTLFEAVTERFVSRDCGAPLHGSNIHIDGGPLGCPGFSNSPDGFCCLRLEGRRILGAGEPAGPRTRVVAALMEFKAPFRRSLKGQIPGYYLPQVWSGLHLSGAEVGCYVEALYRVCTLRQLEDGGRYNTYFHRSRGNWEAAAAWGVAGLYAPLPGGHEPDSPAGRAAAEARDLVGAHLGVYSPPGQGPLVDFGGAPPAVLEAVLALFASGGLQARHPPPVLPGDPPAALEGALAELQGGAPPGHYLLGLLPWKLFEADYFLVDPHPAFMDRSQPVVAELLQRAAEVRAAPDPYLALAAISGLPSPVEQEEQKQQLQQQLQQRQQEMAEKGSELLWQLYGGS